MSNNRIQEDKNQTLKTCSRHSNSELPKKSSVGTKKKLAKKTEQETKKEKKGGALDIVVESGGPGDKSERYAEKNTPQVLVKEVEVKKIKFLSEKGNKEKQKHVVGIAEVLIKVKLEI